MSAEFAQPDPPADRLSRAAAAAGFAGAYSGGEDGPDAPPRGYWSLATVLATLFVAGVLVIL